MKKRTYILLVLTIVVALGLALFFWILPGTAMKTKDGTNVNAADKDIEAFYDELKEYYPQVHERIPENGRVTYTIPGLIQTETIEAKGEDKGEVDTAEDMTPQGLSFVEDYVVISAYSKSHKYNSVLWLLDKKSGKFIKTIVLPTTSHVGGMAYDPDHQRLWVTTTDDESASQISALSLKGIESDNFAKSEKAINFDHQRNLEGVDKSSYMAYYKGSLFVGYFDKEDMGHLGYFELNDKGFPVKDGDMGYQATGVYDTPEQVQGLVVLEDKVIFSQSYASKDSKLLTFKNPGLDKWSSFEEGEDQISELVTPPYMQQIVAEDDNLYLLFESSATKYRLNPLVKTIDRVIKIKAP